MELKPIGEKVIVELLEAQEKTKGGIIVPDAAREKPHEGKVIAVGNGRTLPSGKTIPLEVKPGDKIIFSKYSGNEVKLDDQEFVIVDIDDVLAILK